jgi:hypothetical protein
MVSKLFEHRQFDGARGGAFQLPGRWTHLKSSSEQTALVTQHPYCILTYMHIIIGLRSTQWRRLDIVKELFPPRLLLLQHFSLSLFASDRDQDVTLAAVDAAYRTPWTRAIARNLEISNLLGFRSGSLLLGVGQGTFYGH